MSAAPNGPIGSTVAPGRSARSPHLCFGARTTSRDDRQRRTDVVEELGEQCERRPVDPLHVVDDQRDAVIERAEGVRDPTEEPAAVDPTFLVTLQLAGVEREEVVAQRVEERLECATHLGAPADEHDVACCAGPVPEFGEEAGLAHPGFADHDEQRCQPVGTCRVGGGVRRGDFLGPTGELTGDAGRDPPGGSVDAGSHRWSCRLQCPRGPAASKPTPS